MSAPTAVPLPTTIEDLDAPWLTAVLRADGVIGSDVAVRAVRAERIALDTGFSSELHRLSLDGDPGVPASVVAKLPTGTVVRQAMDMVGGYAREVAFYRDVAGRAPLRTPRAHAARIAEDSSDFVLVLEDLGDWRVGNHFEGLSLADARRCVAELAGLHAWSVTPDAAATVSAFPSLDSPAARQAFPALFAEGWAVYRQRARQAVPPAVAAFGDRISEHVPRLLEGLTERPGLIHGDIRADNLFFRGDDLAIVDFQLTARGVGAADVAYLVSQGLTTETRGGGDERLVREYLELLAGHGAPAYAFEDAWRHYRMGVAFFLLFPVIAIRGYEGLPDQARELCLRLCERSIATITDVDALEVLA
ncbi:MAG: ecdysteroid 22-kinase family protein [Solirubrobacteraceae bacterium]|nr:ecdysteroid 22-kinase family protein [Solirubrobacteraceae bacterium]